MLKGRRKGKSERLRTEIISGVRCKNHSRGNVKTFQSLRKIPERAWIPLYSLYKLGKIPTAIKMQKLVFLIQTEGKVSGYHFFEHHYGPFSRELQMDTRSLSEPLNLMKVVMAEGANYPYFMYSITPKGVKLVENVFQKRIKKETLERVSNIIDKYGPMNYWEIQEYVYKNYVISEETFNQLYPSLRDDLISLDILWKKRYSDDCPASFLILAIVEYATKALARLKEKDDSVLRGVCTASTSELTSRLVELTSICEATEECPFSLKSLFSEVSDYISFLDHYCCQHEILENVLDVDFSDFLNEEELQRLEKAFKTTKPSELIY